MLKNAPKIRLFGTPQCGSRNINYMSDWKVVGNEIYILYGRYNDGFFNNSKTVPFKSSSIFIFCRGRGVR